MSETTALIRIKTEVIDKRRITLDGKQYPAVVIDFGNGSIQVHTADYSELFIHGVDQLKALREVVDAGITVAQQREAGLVEQAAAEA